MLSQILNHTCINYYYFIFIAKGKLENNIEEANNMVKKGKMLTLRDQVKMKTMHVQVKNYDSWSKSGNKL